MESEVQSTKPPRQPTPQEYLTLMKLLVSFNPTRKSENDNEPVDTAIANMLTKIKTDTGLKTEEYKKKLLEVPPNTKETILHAYQNLIGLPEFGSSRKLALAGFSLMLRGIANNISMPTVFVPKKLQKLSDKEKRTALVVMLTAAGATSKSNFLTQFVDLANRGKLKQKIFAHVAA